MVSLVIMILGFIFTRFFGFTSTFTGIYICSLLFFGYIEQAARCFLIYVYLDMIWRPDNDKLRVDIFIHHVFAGVLTIIGLFLCKTQPMIKDDILNVIYYLLLMEITSPILEIMRIYKKKSILLLLLWVPFRIYNPLKALYLVYNIYLWNHYVLIAFLIILLLFVLQIIWFILILNKYINK